MYVCGIRAGLVNSTRLFSFTHSLTRTQVRTQCFRRRTQCLCRSWMKNRRCTQRSVWSWWWLCCGCCGRIVRVRWAVPQHVPGVLRVHTARAAPSLLSPHVLLFTGPLVLLLQAGQGGVVGRKLLAVVHRGMFAGWGTCSMTTVGDGAVLAVRNAPEFGRSVGGRGPCE